MKKLKFENIILILVFLSCSSNHGIVFKEIAIETLVFDDVFFPDLKNNKISLDSEIVKNDFLETNYDFQILNLKIDPFNTGCVQSKLFFVVDKKIYYRNRLGETKQIKELNVKKLTERIAKLRKKRFYTQDKNVFSKSLATKEIILLKVKDKIILRYDIVDGIYIEKIKKPNEELSFFIDILKFS